MKKIYLLAIFLFFALTACSDSTSPENNDPLITGTWEMYYTYNFQTNYDTVDVKLQLKGNNSKLTGESGNLKHRHHEGGTTVTTNITNGDINGTYSENNIDVTLTGIGNTTFNFKGTRNTDLPNETRYIGMVTIKGFNTKTYDAMILFKNK